jgi:hypothetical protein
MHNIRKVLNLLLLFVSMFFSNLSAQEGVDSVVQSIDTINIKKNELKINGFALLAEAGLEVFYERILNESSSLGVSALLPLSEDGFPDLNYYISPYYRAFFGKKHAAGFFVEGFGIFNSLEREIEQPDNSITIRETANDFGVGVGLGGKWTNKKGFIFEINAGIARNLINSNDYEDGTFIGKAGFNLGYRF